jgi:catechol 2,3-dioxygenase-like lactoylglutathione lyase family enzyme
MKVLPPRNPEKHALIEGLDFIYMPTADAARDLGFYRDVLGAEIVFAIEAFGTRVARVHLGDGRPALLLAEHLEGERPVLVFRVGDLEAAIGDLEARGLRPGPRFGIPHGPGCSIEVPGGHRLAIYERTRPEADAHLAGRRDF